MCYRFIIFLDLYGAFVGFLLNFNDALFFEPFLGLCFFTFFTFFPTVELYNAGTTDLLSTLYIFLISKS